MIPTAFDARCPAHGPLNGQTKCRFCDYAIFDVNRPPSSRLDALPRTGNGVGVLSFNLQQHPDEIVGERLP